MQSPGCSCRGQDPINYVSRSLSSLERGREAEDACEPAGAFLIPGRDGAPLLSALPKSLDDVVVREHRASLLKDNKVPTIPIRSGDGTLSIKAPVKNARHASSIDRDFSGCTGDSYAIRFNVNIWYLCNRILTELVPVVVISYRCYWSIGAWPTMVADAITGGNEDERSFLCLVLFRRLQHRFRIDVAILGIWRDICGAYRKYCGGLMRSDLVDDLATLTT